MRALALLALVPLAACSGSSSNVRDAGAVDAGDPLLVFGLGEGNCYELSNTDTSATPPSLGVAVEPQATPPSAKRYFEDGGFTRVTPLTLVYRQTGSVKMTDQLFVDGHDVLLLNRDVVGAEQTEYHPAIVVARVPLKDADHLDQPVEVQDFFLDGGRDDLSSDATYDVAATTLTTPAAPSGVQGFTLTFAGTPRVPSWSFAAGTGLEELSLGLPGDTGAPVYKLQGAKTVAQGDLSCGSAAAQ